MAIIKLLPYKRSLLHVLVIFVVFLSVAFKKAQFHKILAIVAPKGMILAWNRAKRRERLAYENWRHVAIGFKLVVLPKLSRTVRVVQY